MEIIVPAAGRSSRFPNMKPKYLLYDYTGTMMLKNSLAPYMGKYPINIGILQEHVDKFDAEAFIRNEIPGATIAILPEPTTGPAHTVAAIIEGLNIEGPIKIKDCDSFFNCADGDGNYICVSTVPEHETLHKLSAKSFVIKNINGIVVEIIEKKVISDTFCVGGYRFDDAGVFMQCFREVTARPGPEVFVSHVISHAMHVHNHRFMVNEVSDYVDVGTAEDWFKFNDKPVIFCDVDGTVIKAQSRWGANNYDTDPEVLENNVALLRAYLDAGGQIIFTCSRPSWAAERTKLVLERLGFVGCPLMMGLNNARRILINDFNSANPFPRAEAINVRRDADDLRDFFPAPK